MATVSQGAASRGSHAFAGRNGLLDRYFYFAMALLFAVIVVWGFSQTVNANLFHAAPARPVLLWMHGAAFSGWVAFYILQSALVRTRNVAVHRLLGWFGAALAGAMVALGFTVAVIMNHFDKYVLHMAGTEPFLSVPFGDMLMFGTLVGLAIAWRRKPELHRRLLFLATCGLLDAAFGRFAFIDRYHVYHVFVDAVVLLGVLRDLLVDRRVHKVYRVAVPLMMVMQAGMMYLYLGAPAWWVSLTRAIVG
ncbi:MAG TPA: hypothetical protein VE291_07895 [Terracidiphilus sp.]|nr:hypothetical protein [Terracidiphilus sp.]